MRIFNELTPECDLTAQMYAVGLEKKEIADKKTRALSTITNQLQTAFQLLRVKNGRELTVKFFERIIELNMDFTQTARSVIAVSLLAIFIAGAHDTDLRRGRRVRRTDSEWNLTDTSSQKS